MERMLIRSHHRQSWAKVSSRLIIHPNTLLNLGVAPDFQGLGETSPDHLDVTPEGDYEEWVPFTQTGLAVDEEPNADDDGELPSLRLRILLIIPATTSLEEWEPYALHPQLLKTLQARNFLKPTPIQAAALIPALAGRDVVGVAQTVRSCSVPHQHISHLVSGLR